MAEPIISVSGLRGIVGETLTPEVASRYALAFASLLPPGKVLIARDGRPTGPMLAAAVTAALHAAGRDTIDADVLATPTVGVLLRECRAAGAIQITASHNPPAYNGLKLFSAAGHVIPAALGEQVLHRYRRGRLHYQQGQAEGPSSSPPGRSLPCPDPMAAHLHAVLATVDVPRIRRRRFRVLLDSNHGAGAALGRRLLEALGCQVTVLGESPDGQYEHPPEPTAENLAGVLSVVKAAGVEIGFCQDPDADRLAVIDENGHYLSEEYTLALCVAHVLTKRRGPIVTNCATSRMSEDLARRYGVPFIRTAVGEANVVAGMLAHQALFGGEGNGGPIEPRVGMVRDSFVGMALLLDAMAERELPISRLAAELPSYEILKTKLTLSPERVPSGLAALERHFADARPDRRDGLRLDWPDRWLLVRASNTEPIVRVIAEAPTVAEAEKLCQQSAALLAAQ
jgi:phosphomannomutase